MAAVALLTLGLLLTGSARAGDDDLQNLLDSIPDIEDDQPDDGDPDGADAAEDDVPFTAYVAEVRAQVLAAWKPPKKTVKKDPGVVTRLVLTIDESGEVTGIKALQLSGVKRYDERAVDAVNAAGTLPPPPANLVSLAAEGVVVEFSGKDWLRSH